MLAVETVWRRSAVLACDSLVPTHQGVSQEGFERLRLDFGCAPAWREMALEVCGLLEEWDEVVFYACVADCIAFDLVKCLGLGDGVETYRAPHAVGVVWGHHDFDLMCCIDYGRRNR